MPDYSYPQWLIPRHAPWEALVAGVQAGAQIAANNQRARALAQQAEHQAFQETVLREKADADANDLRTLQQWWPTFSSAQGSDVANLTVPPLHNSEMWNRVTMEVEKRKQQVGASELANAFTAFTANPTPENEALVWGVAAKNPWVPIDKIGGTINQIKTAKRLQLEAEETSRRHKVLESAGTITEQNAAAITKLQGLADAARATGDEQTAVEYEKQAEYIQHRPATSSLNQDRLLIEAKIADYQKQIDDIKLSGLKGKALDDAIAPLQSKLAEERKSLHALGSQAGTAPKKQYFNPDTGQLQDTPYAPR